MRKVTLNLTARQETLLSNILDDCESAISEAGESYDGEAEDLDEIVRQFEGRALPSADDVPCPDAWHLNPSRDLPCPTCGGI